MSLTVFFNIVCFPLYFLPLFVRLFTVSATSFLSSPFRFYHCLLPYPLSLVLTSPVLTQWGDCFIYVVFVLLFINGKILGCRFQLLSGHLFFLMNFLYLLLVLYSSAWFLLSIWCKELTHWRRPWCWERLRARGEGGDRGWNVWMASLTQWLWVWPNSGR